MPKIVIDLSKDDFDDIQKHGENLNPFWYQGKILDGTILPKNHGRLIDANKLRNELYSEDEIFDKFWRNEFDMLLVNAPTVIEAEGGAS